MFWELTPWGHQQILLTGHQRQTKVQFHQSATWNQGVYLDYSQSKDKGLHYSSMDDPKADDPTRMSHLNMDDNFPITVQIECYFCYPSIVYIL